MSLDSVQFVKSWRSSISPFEKHLRFPINGCLGRGCNFTLTESVVYHLALPASASDDSSHKANPKRGWLIKVEEGKFGKGKLLHPLSQFFVRQLPKSFPKILNSLEFRVSELARMYKVDSQSGYFIQYYGHYKVALSSDLNFRAVMMVFNGILYHGELDVGNNIEKSVNVSRLREDGDYRDVIFFQGNFYVLCQDGTTIMVDSSLNVTTMASPVSSWSGGENKKNLVESLGELLLIDRCCPAKMGKYKDYVDVWMSSDVKLKVFKLNANEKQWVEVNRRALDDRILIVGDDGSFSVSTRDFPGCSGINIYFSAINYEKYDENFALKGMLNEIGVFRLNLGTHIPLLYYTSENIFNPPPTTTLLSRRTTNLLPARRKRKGEETDLDSVVEQTQGTKTARLGLAVP